MEVHSGSDATVVRVLGELDIATAPELIAALEQLEGRSDRLVVDLSATTFLDSAGLQSVVRSARVVGDRFVLVCPEANTPVRRVVAFAGFEVAVPVMESLAEALARP